MLKFHEGDDEVYDEMESPMPAKPDKNQEEVKYEVPPFLIEGSLENGNGDNYDPITGKKLLMEPYKKVPLKKGIVTKKPLAKNKSEEKFNESFNSLGTIPMDGDNPQIYSEKISRGPISYMPEDIPYLIPPPTNLKQEELSLPSRRTPEEIFKGFEIKEDGLIKSVDMDILSRQKGILTDLIKQAIANCFKADGFLRIALPVRMFESRSGLERVTDHWRLAPSLLTKASNLTDRYERFKLAMAFGLSGLYTSLSQLKPFNPLLGETLQAYFPDGTEINVEQTSHHPPITNFYVVGPRNGYIYSGHYSYKLSFSANSFKGRQEGVNRIKFADGQEIVFHWYPYVQVGGLIAGDRTVKYFGSMAFEDRTSNLRGVLVIDDPNRKKGGGKDQLQGVIYNPKMLSELPKKIKSLKDITSDIGKELYTLEGSWIKEMIIGGTTYWNINQHLPSSLIFHPNPLDTDWRYREDILWLRRQHEQHSDGWKKIMEAEQRRHRALRKVYSPKE